MDYELVHYGVKGQKWGVRRYQNADGTLTPLGKRKIKIRDDYLDKNGNLTEAGKTAFNAKSVEDIAKNRKNDDRRALAKVKENYDWHKKNRSQYDDQEYYDIATKEYQSTIKKYEKRLNQTMNKTVAQVRAELHASDKHKVDEAVERYYSRKAMNATIVKAAVIGAAVIGGRIAIDKWASSGR